jgi:hypothetical protein
MHAPWLSWLQRPTVKYELFFTWSSEGREFEPHWGSYFAYLRDVLRRTAAQKLTELTRDSRECHQKANLYV